MSTILHGVELARLKAFVAGVWDPPLLLCSSTSQTEMLVLAAAQWDPAPGSKERHKH